MFNKHRPIGWVLLFVILAALSGCGGGGGSSSSPTTRDDTGIIQQTSVDGGTIALDGGYLLINNTWNKGATSGPYQERVFTKNVNGQVACGWDWQWGASNAVVAYPEVFYGDTPWDNVQQNVSGIPFLAGTKNVTIDFNLDMQATGVYNMALEFWVTSKAAAVKTDITHEVMIWNYTSGMTPAGTKLGEVTFDGIRYNYYLRNNHGDASGGSGNTWTYIAFQAQTPILHGPLNVSNFINYLIDEGILNSSLYIATMEFGNEIVRGSGRTVISDYSVTIQ